MTGQGEQTRNDAEHLELIWRLVPADPSVQEQLAQAQARAIKEVLTWWTDHKAPSPSKCSQQDREAPDPGA